MELFFNLVWVAVSGILVGLWFLRKDCWADDSLRLNLIAQLSALTLLIAILLPVISLNDDMMAKIMPAESEHISLRNDYQAVADLSLHTLWTALPVFAPTPVAPQPQPLAWLTVPADEQGNLCIRYQRILGIRPPPAI